MGGRKTCTASAQQGTWRQDASNGQGRTYKPEGAVQVQCRGLPAALISAAVIPVLFRPDAGAAEHHADGGCMMFRPTPGLLTVLRPPLRLGAAARAKS